MQGTQPPESYNVEDIQKIGFQPSSPLLNLPWMLRHAIQPEAARILKDIPIEMTDDQRYLGSYFEKRGPLGPKIQVRSGMSDRESREVFGHEAIHALQQLYEGNTRMAPTPSHATSIRAAYASPLNDRALGLEALPLLAQMFGFDISQMPSYLIKNMEEAGFRMPDYPMTNVHGSAFGLNRP